MAPRRPALRAGRPPLRGGYGAPHREGAGRGAAPTGLAPQGPLPLFYHSSRQMKTPPPPKIVQDAYFLFPPGML